LCLEVWRSNPPGFLLSWIRTHLSFLPIRVEGFPDGRFYSPLSFDCRCAALRMSGWEWLRGMSGWEWLRGAQDERMGVAARTQEGRMGVAARRSG
jgi:hypothetical protein